MNRLRPNETEFWNRYLSVSSADANARVSASIAGNETNADLLLQLYLDRKKSAGSSLARDYESSGEPLPTVGGYWMILDSKLNPRCIVRTIRVEIHPFDKVPQYVAQAEGEGDLSLVYWKSAHAEFFQPYLAALGYSDLGQEQIVTEFYELVYKE